MSVQETQLALSALVANQFGLPSPSEPFGYRQFCNLVDEVLVASGLARPRRGADSDSRIVKIFLVMAKHSYHRLLHPAPSPCATELEQVRESRLSAPKTSGELAQSRCDAASICRRADIIKQTLEPGSNVLLLGDDDGLSSVLAAEYDVTVVDVDPRVVKWVRSFGVQAEVSDVRNLPKKFEHTFSAVVADPIRGLEAGWFLDAAQRCLKPQGLYFWADHPDWNYALEALLCEAEPYLRQVSLFENWHQYSARVALEGDEYSQLGTEHQRFVKLGNLISLWSHLYIFQLI